MPTQTISERTFAAACREGGWRTYCAASPLPQGPPPTMAIYGELADGEWEPAGYDREARPGYQYALAHTCSTAGFAGRSSRQYWSRMRRRMEDA